MVTLQTLELIGTITAIVVSMVIGFLYAFGKGTKKNQKDTEDAEDRLAVILKGTVDLLEKKVDEQRKQLDANTEEIKRLSTENETMTRIMQGKDKRSEELYTLAEQNAVNIKNLYSLLERHMGLVEKALNITAEVTHK